MKLEGESIEISLALVLTGTEIQMINALTANPAGAAAMVVQNPAGQGFSAERWELFFGELRQLIRPSVYDLARIRESFKKEL